MIGTFILEEVVFVAVLVVPLIVRVNPQRNMRRAPFGRKYASILRFTTEVLLPTITHET